MRFPTIASVLFGASRCSQSSFIDVHDIGEYGDVGEAQDAPGFDDDRDTSTAAESLETTSLKKVHYSHDKLVRKVVTGAIGVAGVASVATMGIDNTLAYMQHIGETAPVELMLCVVAVPVISGTSECVMKLCMDDCDRGERFSLFAEGFSGATLAVGVAMGMIERGMLPPVVGEVVGKHVPILTKVVGPLMSMSTEVTARMFQRVSSHVDFRAAAKQLASMSLSGWQQMMVCTLAAVTVGGAYLCAVNAENPGAIALRKKMRPYLAGLTLGYVLAVIASVVMLDQVSANMPPDYVTSVLSSATQHAEGIMDELASVAHQTAQTIFK